MFRLGFTRERANKLVLMDKTSLLLCCVGSPIGHICIVAHLLLFSFFSVCPFSLRLRVSYTTFQMLNHSKYLMEKDFHLWENHKTAIQCRLNRVTVRAFMNGWRRSTEFSGKTKEQNTTSLLEDLSRRVPQSPPTPRHLARRRFYELFARFSWTLPPEKFSSHSWLWE